MMGILDLFRSAPARARVEPQIGTPAGVQASGSLASESQWSGFVTGRVSRAGVVVNERTTMSLPAVMQALRMICGVFAMTPLAYYRRTAEGRERASDDPLWTLLHDRPNQTQSAFAFKELLLADVLLTGNFYAYVSRDSRMRPVALTRIKPGNVTVHDYFDRAGGLELFYDATLPDKSHERFSARDIWHIAGPTRDGEVGLSPLDYMRAVPLQPAITRRVIGPIMPARRSSCTPIIKWRRKTRRVCAPIGRRVLLEWTVIPSRCWIKV
jgi:hypothetical protein